MRVIGLLLQGGDPSATLVEDNEIIAIIEEERIIRSKHAINIFPYNSVKKCLEICNCTLDEIDIIAVGWDASCLNDIVT